MAAVRLLLLDLVDKYHRVAGDHAGKGQHAKKRDETQRLVRKEEGRDDPNDTQRGHAEH
jgi:hypothetical protein